jgi:hypothetical protein
MRRVGNPKKGGDVSNGAFNADRNVANTHIIFLLLHIGLLESGAFLTCHCSLSRAHNVAEAIPTFLPTLSVASST